METETPCKHRYLNTPIKIGEKMSEEATATLLEKGKILEEEINRILSPRTKIWYVLQAYDCVGETTVNLFRDGFHAKEFFDEMVEKNKQWARDDHHEKELTNDDYCTITDDYAFFSGEILGGNMDSAITLSWQEIDL